jgi:hypothetical protein
MIFFYSSDITALFKKDIIKVLSLPKGYCIHFRYSDNDLSEIVSKKLPNVINQDGLIIYAKNNIDEIPIGKRQLNFLPIRRISITNYRKDQQTKLHHFNLELGDFVQGEPVYPDKNSMPPYEFVSEGNIGSHKNVSWIEKVEELVRFDSSFKSQLFFNVMILNNSNQYDNSYVETLFDFGEEKSYFRLSESQSYILGLSIFISETDLKEIEKYECRLEYDKKDLLISNPNSIVIGTQKDNRRYTLVTKAVEGIKSFDYLKIVSGKNEGLTPIEFYETTIRFNINKNNSRAFVFIVLFLFNLIGTAWFASLITKKAEFVSYILPIALVVVSAFGQYYFYNKKT